LILRLTDLLNWKVIQDNGLIPSPFQLSSSFL
jgi:hypothetical protein